MRPPEADVGLYCTLLDYKNPYLRLGPFKYEALNLGPHVGLFRHFFGDTELDEIVEDSKDKLHSTVYYVCIYKYGVI